MVPLESKFMPKFFQELIYADVICEWPLMMLLGGETGLKTTTIT